MTNEGRNELRISRLSTPYKCYVWVDRGGRWVAMAHARSVQEARSLAIEDATGVLGEADWSTPVTADMIAMIRNSTPAIHYRGNAETVLTSSGQLEETSLYVETLQARVKLLESALADTLKQLPEWTVRARAVLDAPLRQPPTRSPGI